MNLTLGFAVLICSFVRLSPVLLNIIRIQTLENENLTPCKVLGGLEILS